ncbi:MAG: hypothetical protein P1U65_18860 [Minwuia sp.]|nr:hypothetical protein [Minwuia sp.]
MTGVTRLKAATLHLAACAALLAPLAAAASEPVTFAALGDTPYQVPRDDFLFERLIDEINTLDPVLSIHVGDIKSGSSPCNDMTLLKVRTQFNRFRGPLFYTPGDNEWTDCHRGSAGNHDPYERLARLRQFFFSQPTSFGQNGRTYQRQSDAGQYPEMVENAIWTESGIVFATVHVVGSSNGRKRKIGPEASYEMREAANMVWLRRAFETAARTEAPALVIAIHANPEFRKADKGFARTLAALAAGAASYGGPVLLVHGDTHSYRTDRPLHDENDRLVRNLWRLEVPGSPDVGAVIVTIDPTATPPFSFRPLLVEEAYDASSTTR